VIVPSLPDFGFSSPLPENPDMNFWRVADFWHTLMTRGPRRGTEIRRSVAI
jgi:microsomal epoxide hydrolase